MEDSHNITSCLIIHNVSLISKGCNVKFSRAYYFSPLIYCCIFKWCRTTPTILDISIFNEHSSLLFQQFLLPSKVKKY